MFALFLFAILFSLVRVFTIYVLPASCRLTIHHVAPTQATPGTFAHSSRCVSRPLRASLQRGQVPAPIVSWHRADDRLAGTAVYGEWEVADPVSDESFSRRWDHAPHNEFLFSDGEGSSWVGRRSSD